MLVCVLVFECVLVFLYEQLLRQTKQGRKMLDKCKDAEEDQQKYAIVGKAIPAL